MYDLIKVYLHSGEVPIEKVVYFDNGLKSKTFYPMLHRGMLCDTIIFGDDYVCIAFRVSEKKLRLYRCNVGVVEIMRNGCDVEVTTNLDGVKIK